MGCFHSKRTRAVPRRLVVLGLDRSGKSSVVVTLLRNSVALADTGASGGKLVEHSKQSSTGIRLESQVVSPDKVDIHCAPPVTAKTEVLNITVDGMAVGVVDTVGSAKGRALWPSILQQATAALFVVDCSDTLRMPLVAHELKSVGEQLSKRKVPILVLANKFDSANMTIHDICTALGGVPVCPVRYPLPQISLRPLSTIDSLGINEAVKHVLYAGEAAPGPMYVSPEDYMPAEDWDTGAC